jgi:putative transposase
VKRREIIDWTREKYPVSARAACSLLQFPRSSYYYQSQRDPRTALRMRLKEVAASRPRFGYRRLHLLLAGEAFEEAV